MIVDDCFFSAFPSVISTWLGPQLVQYFKRDTLLPIACGTTDSVSLEHEQTTS